MDREKH